MRKFWRQLLSNNEQQNPAHSYVEFVIFVRATFARANFTRMPFDHPGGKLRDVGPESLTDKEILAIIISSGTNGHSAEDIAQELIDEFGSIAGMAGEPLERFLKVKGMGDVKIIRLAAALELARRAAFYFDHEPQTSLKLE